MHITVHCKITYYSWRQIGIIYYYLQKLKCKGFFFFLIFTLFLLLSIADRQVDISFKLSIKYSLFIIFVTITLSTKPKLFYYSYLSFVIIPKIKKMTQKK